MYRFSRIAVIALCLWLLAASAAAAQPGSCRPSDAFSENYRRYLSQVVAGTDSASDTTQRAFRLLPALASEVTFVTDDSLCARAATAFISAIGDS